MEIPKQQIRFIVDRMHVGTPDEEIRADIRRRTSTKKAAAMGWTPAKIKAAEDYAVKVMNENRKMYAYVMGGSVGRKNPKDTRGVDSAWARELELYIDNDADLYRQQYQPILKNLATKKARGIYKHELAVKLMRYLIDNGVKKYLREFDLGGNVNKISIATRNAVAESFVKSFETEYDLGNYDRMLPKKYQGQAHQNPQAIPMSWKRVMVRRLRSGQVQVRMPARSRR